MALSSVLWSQDFGRMVAAEAKMPIHSLRLGNNIDRQTSTERPTDM